MILRTCIPASAPWRSVEYLPCFVWTGMIACSFSPTGTHLGMHPAATSPEHETRQKIAQGLQLATALSVCQRKLHRLERTKKQLEFCIAHNQTATTLALPSVGEQIIQHPQQKPPYTCTHACCCVGHVNCQYVLQPDPQHHHQCHCQMTHSTHCTTNKNEVYVHAVKASYKGPEKCPKPLKFTFTHHIIAGIVYVSECLGCSKARKILSTTSNHNAFPTSSIALHVKAKEDPYTLV